VVFRSLWCSKSLSLSFSLLPLLLSASSPGKLFCPCLNNAKKLVSSALRLVPWVDGERVKINEAGGVALVVAGGGVVGICHVVACSQARMFRPLGIVAFVVLMFSVLREGGEAEALWWFHSCSDQMCGLDLFGSWGSWSLLVWPLDFSMWFDV